MLQALSSLLEKEKEDFFNAYEEFSLQMQEIQLLIQSYYEQAFEKIDTGKYYFNTSIIKELKMYMHQITSIVKMADNGTNLFLLTTNSLHEEELEQQYDLDQFIEKFRARTQLILKKAQLEERTLYRIKSRCSTVNSIILKSNPLKIQQIIGDSDVLLIKNFPKISTLSLKGSNVSDSGMNQILKTLHNLKEIDLSQCYILGNQTLKHLSGYQFVSIKLNKVETISQLAIYSLISSSYNLNYLEICNNRQINCRRILCQIGVIYDNNKSNFKWLQLVSNLGVNLFVNKLSYLTHLTNVESIVDKEVEILLGQQPLIDGIYFTNCDQLSRETVNLISKKCSKIKRLTLKRFLRLTDSLLSQLVSSLIKLEQLDLSKCYSITGKSLIQIGNQLSRLKEINLTDCTSLEDNGFIYLVEKMPTLTHINIAHCKSITDNTIYHICNCLPNLQSLNIQRCEQITDDPLVYLSERLLNLEELIVNYCDRLTDSSLSLIAMRLKKLKKLEIEWCSVTQKCIGFICENLIDLQEINFNYCPSVCDESITSLAKNAPKIHTIKLQSCDKLGEKTFLNLFQNLKSLKFVGLKQCKGVTDTVIRQLSLSTTSELMHLDLSWCHQISDKGLFSLSQYQHQILYLNLSGCSEISDSAIQWVSSTITKLEFLNITLCDKLTDKSVIEISKRLLNLRILYLCDLRSITDSSVSSLASLPNLEQLHLKGCKQITSSSLIALLHNLEKLQCLNISECSNIFPESLILLVERMRNLKKFQIAFLDVEDKFLDAIGQYMEKLQVINLEYCRKIKEEAVVRLMERLPSLLRLDIQNTEISERARQTIFHQISSRKLHNVIR